MPRLGWRDRRGLAGSAWSSTPVAAAVLSTSRRFDRRPPVARDRRHGPASPSTSAISPTAAPAVRTSTPSSTASPTRATPRAWAIPISAPFVDDPRVPHVSPNTARASSTTRFPNRTNVEFARRPTPGATDDARHARAEAAWGRRSSCGTGAWRPPRPPSTAVASWADVSPARRPAAISTVDAGRQPRWSDPPRRPGSARVRRHLRADPRRAPGRYPHAADGSTATEVDLGVVRQRAPRSAPASACATRRPRGEPDELAAVTDTGGDPTRWRMQRRERTRPRHLHRAGKAHGDQRAGRRRRHRPRDVRRRAHPRPATQPRTSSSSETWSTASA